MILPVSVAVPYVSTVLSLIGVVLFGALVWAVLAIGSGLLEWRQVLSLLR